MLSVLEDLLVEALQSAHANTVRIAAGPSHWPTSGQQQEVVIVAAHSLEVKPGPSDAEPESARSPSYLLSVHRWSADGVTRDFHLPEDVTGDIAEVESPPRHPAKRGDDYFVEGRVIRFYRPPAQSDDAVVATVHGNLAQGYQEKRDCTAKLEIAAWAMNMQHADELLQDSLSVVLPLLVDIGTLDQGGQSDFATRIRILKPVAALTRIDRQTQDVGQSDFFRAIAHFTIQAQLEVIVAVGEPESEALIESVELEFDSPTTLHDTD